MEADAQQNRQVSNWITIVENGQEDLIEEEYQKFQRLIDSDVYLDGWVVEVKPLEEVVQEDVLRFHLPGMDFPLTAYTSQVDDAGIEGAVWVGEFPDQSGFVTVVNDEGQIYGHIQSGEVSYVLFNFDFTETSVLLKKNSDQEGDGHQCGLTSDIESTMESKSPIRNTTPSTERLGALSNCEVDVLILYTQGADLDNPNIVQTANLALAETNAILSRSWVSKNDLTLRLVAVEALPSLPTNWSTSVIYTPVSNSPIFDDVNALATDQFATGRRNFHNADIVLCLVGDDYPGVFGVVAEWTDPSLAYGLVVESSTLGDRLSFPHELAHLFNCRHDSDNSPTSSYARGHSFWKWFKWYRTVLADLPAGKERIPYYSNPSVSYNGKATGVAGSNDNTRMLEERGCIVANYEQGTIAPLQANILGPSSSTPYSYVSFQADVSGGGIGNYSYEWRVSTSGSPTGSVLSTSPNLWTTVPNNPYSNMYVHLRVTSADGQVRNRTRTVFIQPSGGGFYRLADAIEGDLKVYPNPTTDKALLEFESSETGIVEVEIINTMGQVLYADKRPLEEGLQVMKLDLSSFPTGLYLVRIATQNTVRQKQIMLN